MNVFLLEPGVAGAISLLIKASVVLALAAVVQLALTRGGSAATRHFVWTLALLTILLLPFAAAVLPSWRVVVDVSPGPSPAIVESLALQQDATTPPASPARRSAQRKGGPADARTADTPRAPESPSISVASMISAGYVAVMVALLLRVLFQLWKARRLGRRASAVADPEWLTLLDDCAASMGTGKSVRLLRSTDHGVPAALGLTTPAILIPVAADTWNEDRRRAVLLHEMAHVARRDCLTQWLASLACAIYWCHPAVWWIAARLRIERELACDDRVIAAGTDAQAYAGHLLEIAYAFGRHRAAALAVSMARARHLEGRMLAALDARRNRTSPARRARRAAVAAAAALVLAIAPMTPSVAAIAPLSSIVEPAAPAEPGRAEWLSAQTLLQDGVRRLVRAAAALGVTQDRLPGTWQIGPTKTEGHVHLTLVEFRSSHGTDVPLSELDGLTAAQLAAGGPVTFRLRRDAGTFTFEGVARSGIAAGTFTFAPNAAFPGELAKRGFSAPTAGEQYDLARGDIGFAYLDELTRQGYAKPSTAELVRAAQHGVRLSYLREMGSLGYRPGTLEPLITLRDHGVTPDFIRGLAAEGYKSLSAEELLRTRDHGVTPDYVREMRDAGYGSIPLERLVNARDHGITPDYVRQLAEAGYRKLPLEEIIRVRDHGVSAEYVRDMRQLGYSLSLDDLVRARDHGVSVEYVRDMQTLGYGKLPIESLIRARDHGVSTEYVRELQRLGYERLPLEDLIALRDHGLSAERIRSLNAKAGSKLPLDLLRSIAGIRER
jgi:beta-lactamase regulating signal transducer with metallopeptidase domain